MIVCVCFRSPFRSICFDHSFILTPVRRTSRTDRPKDPLWFVSVATRKANLHLNTLSICVSLNTLTTKTIMSLQIGIRRGLASTTGTTPTFRSSATHACRTMRWQSSGADAGDVIGIDLGTTNSCVSIMVRVRKRKRNAEFWCRRRVLLDLSHTPIRVLFRPCYDSFLA